MVMVGSLAKNECLRSGSDSFIVLLVDLADIRRLVIVAMFSDDELFGKLVSKGVAMR